MHKIRLTALLGRVAIAGLFSLLASSTPAGAQEYPAFFNGQAVLTSTWNWLAFPNNNLFGYYAYAGGGWLYHEDLGWEYYLDANANGNGAIFFYDSASANWFWTDPAL